MEVLFVLGIVWFLCGIFGAQMSKDKGRSGGVGFFIGFLFGPLGMLIVAAMPSKLEGTGSTLGSPASAVAKNPAESDWIDLVDWSNVKTEEDEEKAKKSAYLKYLTIMGPKIESEMLGDEIYVTCQCGCQIRVPAEKVGRAFACPRCKLHFVVRQPGYQAS